MPEETPSERWKRWASLASAATREFDLYKTKLDWFTDERKRHDQKLERLRNETKEVLETLGGELKLLSGALSVARERPADIEDQSDLEEIQSQLDSVSAKFKANFAASSSQYRVAQQEYEALCHESDDWLRYTPETVQLLREELSGARIAMEHVLYAMKLGKTANRKDAKSHIIRYTARHPDASLSDICDYLDSKDIPFPTKKWKQTVESKYGYAFWKYSFEGNIEKKIPADEKITHRTRQYIWRCQNMGNDLRALIKIKRAMKLRKLELPKIEVPPNPDQPKES